MDTLKASVIIPVLNRKALLLRTIQSVVSQSWRPLEIIIVDNGSVDGTYEEACKCADAINKSSSERVVKVVKCDDPGAANARNMGYHHSTGEVVLFFDSDDIMTEGTLEAYMNAFIEHPKTDIVVGDFKYSSPRKKETRRRRRHGDLLLSHFYHCTLNTISYASRRTFLKRMETLHGELWPSHLGVWDDWAFGFRLLMARPKVLRLDRIVAEVLPNDTSITGAAYCLTPAERYLSAIADIETTLQLYRKGKDKISPSKFRYWKNRVLYRRVVIAAFLTRESKRLSESVIAKSPYFDREELLKESRRLFSQAVEEAPDRKTRRLLGFAYRYISAGLRGCATIINPVL